MKILYLTFFESIVHDGIYETQVKQLLCKLAEVYRDKIRIAHFALLPAVTIGRRGVSVFLFEERQELVSWREEYRQHGIEARCVFLPFIALRRWGSQLPLPVLAVLIFFSLPILAVRIARSRPDVIHCRSYMATVIALSLKVVFPKLRVVFDPRGFWPEEGVVEGRWREGSLSFRLWKRIEKYAVNRSDVVIALSQSFAQHVRNIDPQVNCSVIYTSVDVERFQSARAGREQRRKQLGFDGCKVFVYNGSLGSWHDPVVLARAYCALRQNFDPVKLLVLTTYNKQKLESVLHTNGLKPNEFLIKAARPEEVPWYLAAADYGLVPLKDINGNGSMAVVADTMIGTKVAEYLASGLPLIVNRKVGGIQPLVAGHRIGFSFDSHKLQEMPAQFEDVLQNRRKYQADCECVARRYFSVERVAEAYFGVYKRLVRGLGASEEHCPIGSSPQPSGRVESTN